MDIFDRQLLNLMQENFPISKTPYRDLAATLGITEEEVLARVKKLKDAGIIRRIGGIINSRAMGYYSTLCAVHIKESQLDQLVQYLDNITAITHNYLRDHYYNLWFTLTLASLEEVQAMISQIENEFNVEILQLPAIKTYKIKVSFEMGEEMQYDINRA